MKTIRKYLPQLIVVALLMMIACGCAAMENFVSRLKGELIGNDYEITQFDNWGNKTLTVYGDKITMDCETDESGEPTSYIDITIDGHEWQHVGSTLVFAQAGDMATTTFLFASSTSSKAEHISQ